MIRRPPRSTLFPYRRSSDLAAVNLEPALRAGEPLGGHLLSGHVDGVGEILNRDADARSLRLTIGAPAPLERSEEHTSELQSRSDLVCRLLLGKKKNMIIPTH